MDPTATLTKADQSISDGDLTEAMAALDDYREWRAKGGFQPVEVAGTLMHGDEFAGYCQRRLHDRAWQVLADAGRAGANADLKHPRRAEWEEARDIVNRRTV